MSVRVVSGLAPQRGPHPTTKWSLLMILLVVVVLVLPMRALAGQPSVSPPSGPQSGGVFTGGYTFNTYISCSGGFSFNSSYSNSLDGTHTFRFYGSADGSLLVTINNGGLQLVTSCGDPFTGPNSIAATYTVSKNTAPPPTPTPTPAPTPTPTPPPPTGGGGGSTPTPTPRATSTAPSGGPVKATAPATAGGTAVAVPAEAGQPTATPVLTQPGETPEVAVPASTDKPSGGPVTSPGQSTAPEPTGPTDTQVLATKLGTGLGLILIVLASMAVAPLPRQAAPELAPRARAHRPIPPAV